jgi:hypothetical protein
VNTKAGHFHHPFGDPSRELEAERKWRLGAAREALRVLTEPVEGPTIFDY